MEKAFDFVLFGCLLKESRKTKGITQAKLAEMVDVEVSFISKLERAKAVPSFSLFLKLVEILNISGADLFDSSKNSKEIQLLNLVRDCNDREVQFIIEVCSSAVVAFRKMQK